MSVEDVAFDLSRAHDRIAEAPIDQLQEQITEMTKAGEMASKIREVMDWLHAKGEVAKEATAVAGQAHEGFEDGMNALLSAVDDDTNNGHAINALTDATTLERRSDYLRDDMAGMPERFTEAYRAIGTAALLVDRIAEKTRGMSRDVEDQVAGRDRALHEITAYKTHITTAVAS